MDAHSSFEPCPVSLATGGTPRPLVWVTDHHFLPRGNVFIIWRVWGWLTLVVILAAWGLANVAESIYRNATQYEYVYNPEKAVAGGIAVIVVALLFAAFVVFVLPRLEKVPHNGAAVTAHLEERKARQAAEKRGEPLPERPLAKFWKTRSSTFFIPMFVQPVIFLIIGILMIALNLGEANADVLQREGS